MISVYPFSDNFMEKSELGNKGANLVAMTHLNLPVPPGFTVSIQAYKSWQQTGIFPEAEIEQALNLLEIKTGKKLGQGLEVSVRSSAPASMPGMMDTILNIGDVKVMKQAIKKIFESWDNPRRCRIPPSE